MSESVTLTGGPFDGTTVDVNWGTTLVCSGGTMPEGTVARYRPTRTRGVYRFREYDHVVASLPWPPNPSSSGQRPSTEPLTEGPLDQGGER